MYAKYDSNNRIIDFYENGEWIIGMSLEETELFLYEIMKVISSIKAKGEQL